MNEREELIIHEPGNRFATLSNANQVLIWEVNPAGVVLLASDLPTQCCAYHNAHCQLDRPACCDRCPAEPLEDVEPS